MSTVFLPHETRRPRAVFTCWPAAADLWEDDLIPAQDEFGAFLRAVRQGGPGGSELDLTVFAATAQAEASARQALGARVKIRRQAYGDVWTRDTGPVFLERAGERLAARFRFNGWGGKYLLDGDVDLAPVIAAEMGARLVDVDLVAEGGALEFDGEGTVLTTRQCLLNSNRNPGLSETQVEARLKEALGVEKVLWIDEGLVADHTDGHVDNIVRFVRPGVVVCQRPWGADDPQARVLTDIARQLHRMTDARGRRLQIRYIPSPGRVENEDGELMPASYMNWVIGPRNLVVPVYGTPSEAAALQALRGVFTELRVAGLSSRAILSGGGAFHCVTCHVPGG